jgi:outer membrane receptor protein involved in Fe transport
MKQTLTFIIFFLSISISFTQISIKGLVKDDSGMPILYGSVALIGAVDSILIKGALTDENGNYSIDNVSAGSYRILGSYVGYDDVYSNIFEIKLENKSVTVDLNFLNKGIALAEAVVVAKKPFLEQKADRLVVNVSNSAIAAGATAVEILKKVPGVVIIQNKVTLGGSTSLQIYVDGKPSPYTDVNALLRDMPGDQIEKIEFITQPGSQFDAAGGPILNVVLKRNADLGFKGTATLTLGGFPVDNSDVGAGTEYYGRWNPSINATYRSGKINLFANTTYNTGNYFDVFIVDRYIGSDIYRGRSIDRTNYNYRSVRFGADYYINDKTTIGTIFRTWARNGDGKSLNITDVYNNSIAEPYNSFKTENITDSDRKGYFGNISLKHEFNKELDRTFTADFDYNQFNSSNVNNLSIYPSNEPTTRSYSQQAVDQPVDIIVSKLDYKHGIDSTFKFETGMKFSFAKVNNDLNFTRNTVPSPLESNEFLYKENINAGYINLNKKLNKLEFNTGLRVEQTIVDGTTSGTKVLSRNYTQYFPSASALYRVNNNIAVQSSYSKRVNRPGFNQQNPFSYFIDSLTYTRGNPNLKPEIVNTGELKLTFDGQPFFGVSYSKTNDVIIQNAPKLEGTKTFTIAENLANQERLEIQLNFPIKFGKYIDGFGGNQAIRNSYNATYLGSEYKTSRWHWLAYWQINGNLPKDFKLEIGGFYMTKFLQEFLLIDNLLGIDLGISKSFADKKGRVSLSFDDILYSQKTNALIEFNNIKVNFLQREYSRNLRLTLSYQFGNTKMKGAASRKTASESESSRVKID